MDSLTAHYLARELDARWRGRRLKGGALRSATREVVVHVEGSDPVAFDLSSSDVRVHRTDAPQDGERLAGWIVVGVSAPLDDRRLEVSLERPGKFRGSPAKRARLDISVVPAARGAALRDAGGHLAIAIGSRIPRPVKPRPELPPGDVERFLREDDTDALLGGRWMSPAVLDWLRADPKAGLDRYRELVALSAARPSRCGDRIVPLPLCDDAAPVDSLIEELPRPEPPPAATPDDSPRGRAMARMRSELERARDAPRWRAAADHLLLLGDVPAPSSITLADGSAFQVDARAGESAVQTAERLYRAVRSMERASERLPERLRALERERAEPVPRRPAAPAARGRAQPRAAPFRRYQSSGGLEILVGRGAASNDALTFRVASPDEVWLHARGAAGAHVVLRWSRDEPPPARDLHEAAALAAWHSKSRGSAIVPVDWTRRKYVRRPRGSAPGLVMVTRAETVMARPDGALERSLRAALPPSDAPND